MLMISQADVASSPFPHVIKQGILPEDLFAELRASFPRATTFEQQKQVSGSAGSRTGNGFDIYRGDPLYIDLCNSSSAWREFDRYINSDQFLQKFLEVFADHIPHIGLRVDIENSVVDENYFEPREILTETATTGDKIKTLGLRAVDLFRPPQPADLFTRLDIHKSTGGYAKPPHCDRPNRLCSLIVYFTDAEKAGLEGGDLMIFRHKNEKNIRSYERHPSKADVTEVARLRPKPNLGVFFPCQNNSYHGVTAVKSAGIERDFLYINISGKTASLW